MTTPSAQGLLSDDAAYDYWIKCIKFTNDVSLREAFKAGYHVANSRANESAAQQEYIADTVRRIDQVSEDFDFNPEGTGELSGRDALLEFTHSDDFEDILRGCPSPDNESAAQQELSRETMPGSVATRQDGALDQTELNPAASAAPDAQQDGAESATPRMITTVMDSQYADELGVERFAQAMLVKLAKKRNEGRHGWNLTHGESGNDWGCTVRDLETMLRQHLAKGDVVDVANFCMMIWNRRNPKGLK